MNGMVSPRLALRISQMVAAICALLAVTVGWRTFRRPDAHLTAVAPAPAMAAPRESRSSLTDADLTRVVAADPFSPDRSAPDVKYRIGRAPSGPEMTAPIPMLVRLLGTVVSPDGQSFAMCQLGTDAPRSVHVGQTVGTLKLQSVSQGSAVFTDATGTRVTLRVPTGGK